MSLTTRVAPSPTGDFHIGTARTAYFNWLAARASGGKFILRIDDTDQSRNIPGSIDVIHNCLDWLGLIPDSILQQSDRLDRYRQVADALLDAGLADHADNGAVTLASGAPTDWNDLTTGVMVPGDTHRDLAKNQVILRADGSPVYHFASVVDDIDLGVNLIIRGMDHQTNTFRHTAIYKALGAPLPDFAHVGLITLDKKKLSKRDTAASLLSYRDAGMDAGAMLNFLLRMGWGPGHDDKSMAIIDKGRAVDLFLSAGKLKSSPAALDLVKLASFDRKYKARQKPI